MIFNLAEILDVLYLVFPGFFANMSPVFFSKVKFLNSPVDFGKYLGKSRILGDNKTFRGFFFGILVAVVICFIKIWLPVNTNYEITLGNFWYVGFLLGFGALFGDALESFFKRRASIEPGKPWIPFDEIDHVLGSVILVSFVFFVPFFAAFWIVVFAVPVHIIVNLVAYFLKLRKDML